VSEVKSYEIGGKTYEQRELVLGQWRQLSALLSDLKMPAVGSRLQTMIAALENAGRLERAIAVLLNEPGVQPRDKNLDALAAELEFSITPQQIAEVIDDFFTCNPVSSILSRLGMSLVKMVGALHAALQETGLTVPFVSSPAGISPAAITSSGEIPRESPPST
jgi:hypothetical protein